MKLRVPFVRISDISITTESDFLLSLLKSFFTPFVLKNQIKEEIKKSIRAFSVSIKINPAGISLAKNLRWDPVSLYDRVGWIAKHKHIRFIGDGNTFLCSHHYFKNEFLLETANEEIAYIEGRCLIRACIEKLLFEEGFILFHGAVVVSQKGKGILIVGDKGTGKTTTLMQLIDGGFKYLENDRVFLRLSREGLIALPRPAFMRVGVETCRQVKFLESFVSSTRKDPQDKIIFDRFLETTGIPYETTTVIRAVVVTNLFVQRNNNTNREILSRSVLSDVPGFSALHAYFPDCYYRPVSEKVVSHLKNLPIYTQMGTNSRSLIKFGIRV